MSRNLKTDTPRLTHRLSQLTRRSDGGKGELQPMWLMMFPEGTNLSKNGRAKSVKWAERQGEKDLKYTLIPRSTGTYFCLKALKGTLEWVYDCTLAYDGVPYVQILLQPISPPFPRANAGADFPTERDNTAKTSSRYAPRTLKDTLKRLFTCIGDGSRCLTFRSKPSRVSTRG